MNKQPTFVISVTNIAHLYVFPYVIVNKHILIIIDKGKAIPLQSWTDPEGSRRLRLPDFKTVGT